MSPAVALLFVLQAPSLPSMIKEHAALVKADWGEKFSKLPDYHLRLFALIESNVLDSPEQFVVASNLVITDSADYEVNRVQYELTYTAAALGQKESTKKLAERWDALLVSLGRNRTLGAIDMSKMSGFPATYNVVPTAKCIRDVLLHPESPVTGSKDNPEIAQMFKEDQDVRQGEFTQDKIKLMIDGDAKRMKRISELLKKNQLRTGQDFYYAAFLYQHGATFAEYQTAHELSLCAMVLGHKGGKWIGAASYDRMLRSCGHRQRWATQYGMAAGKTVLQAFDPAGMSDFQRKSVVGLTLEEAKNRKFD